MDSNAALKGRSTVRPERTVTLRFCRGGAFFQRFQHLRAELHDAAGAEGEDHVAGLRRHRGQMHGLLRRCHVERFLAAAFGDATG